MMNMLKPAISNAARGYLAGTISVDELSNVAHESLADDADDLSTPEARSILRLVHLIADLDSGTLPVVDFRVALAELSAANPWGSRPPARTGTSVTTITSWLMLSPNHSFSVKSKGSEVEVTLHNENPHRWLARAEDVPSAIERALKIRAKVLAMGSV